MRVFVVGASGAIGSRLVPKLVDRGHEVIGTSTSPAGAQRVRHLGAKPLALDLLDARAVRKAVLAAEPEAIIHEATALANVGDLKHFDRTFQQTNRLRTEGSDALLAAAREAGVPRFVAQSNANHRYAREGGAVKSEHDPLDPTPVPTARESSEAMRHLDQAVTDAGGIALRYGIFYGAANDGLIEPVRKRQFPIVGDGGGVSSWIHLDDAAAATVLALEVGPRRRLQHRARSHKGSDLLTKGLDGRPDFGGSLANVFGDLFPPRLPDDVMSGKVSSAGPPQPRSRRGRASGPTLRSGPWLALAAAD